ncbi:MAG: chemotaxis-specific protein-glutamate methyltransferase CheB [Desulfobulbaceae bacterium]
MKIGIVNDLPMVVETLRRVVTAENRHQVIWAAENGRVAIECCAQRAPDLILMDLIMPVMDGVEATRRIMKLCPCPILIVTSTVTGNSAKVFEAMGAGALDAVVTPVLGGGDGVKGKELLVKIDQIAKITGIEKRFPAQSQVKTGELGASRQAKGPFLLLLGSSTGGPQALVSVLQDLPRDFPAAVVVVQHMDEQFTSGLATWLNTQLEMKVRVLREGDRPQAGEVLVAATNDHVIMRASKNLGYSVEPKNNYYHPSVDVLFNSVARHWQGRCVGVVLTGMGRDGAEGLLNLRRCGHHTIAQDQKSSVVFGMPKAAIEAGAAKDILPVNEIGAKLKTLVGR